MNTTASCVVLGIGTVLVLPLILAALLGWEPPLPHRDTNSPRLLASVALAAYAAAFAEAAPRLASASKSVVTACSRIALLLALLAVALGIAYERTAPLRDRRRD